MGMLRSGILGIVFTGCLLADIAGNVFRDYNLNGTKDTNEPGVAGVTVKAYDDNGVVATATTDANGDYTLTLSASGNYRVEVSGIPDYLHPGTASNGTTKPPVDGVADGSTHNIGLINEGEYCQADPDIILSRFSKYARTGANANEAVILQHKYTDNVNDAPTNLLIYSQIGSIYGIAYRKSNKVTYLGTYFKRHADLGPSGVGAIYKYDNTAGTFSTFATLPGSDPRNAGGGYDWNHDTVAYQNVGKVGVGDIDISDDESKLFAVNLFDRKLYVFDLDTNGDATATNSYAIPNPCPTTIDFRPMGLGFKDGLLYVGVTCTAESTVDPNNADASYFGPRKGDRSQLSAHIYTFSPQLNVFSASSILDINLTYQRGCVYHGDISNATPPGDCAQLADHDGIPRPFVANWNPWQMDYDIVFNDKAPGNVGNQNDWIEYMQPLLSDIEFASDGSMLIQIRDVNGDRGGYQDYSPNPSDTTQQNINTEGDLLKACYDTGLSSWVLENNGNCGGITTAGAGNNEGPGGGEFFWNDNGPGGTNHSNVGVTGTNGHADTAMGGLLVVPGTNEVVTGMMDIHDFLDNGIAWFNTQTGEVTFDGNGDPKKLLVAPVNQNAFYGKGAGIGDIEALCDPAPLEIGNYVWDDADKDGIQDPSESPLPNVTVELYEGNTLVGTATTDSNGYYTFGGINNANMSVGNVLKPNTSYQLRIALNDSALGGRVPTQRNVSGNTKDTIDSDGDNGNSNNGYSTIALVTGNYGENNYTYDFGFYTVPPYDLALKKTIDLLNSQSATVNPGDTVKYVIYVYNQGTQDVSNVQIADYIPAGMTLDAAASPGWSVSGTQATYSVGNIAAGASTFVSITLMVDSNFTGLTLTNTAEIASFTDTGGNTVTDGDSTPDNNANNDVIGGNDTINNENNDEDDHDIETIYVTQPLVCQSFDDFSDDGNASGISSVLYGTNGAYDSLLQTGLSGVQGGSRFLEINPLPGAYGDGSLFIISSPQLASLNANAGSYQNGRITYDANGAGLGLDLSTSSALVFKQFTADTLGVVRVTLEDSGGNQATITRSFGFEAALTNVDVALELNDFTGIGSLDLSDINKVTIEFDGLRDAVDESMKAINYCYVPGSWSGNVSEDTNNDNVGDVNMQGVTIELFTDPNCDGSNADGVSVDTNTTDSNGNYSFSNLVPGCYVAIETQPNGYVDVTEKEGGDDGDFQGSTPVNTISGKVDALENDSGNDFVERATLCLGDYVWEDVNQNGIQDAGESAIQGVAVTVKDTSGNVIGTATTDASGAYQVCNLTPNTTYTVEFTTPNGYGISPATQGGDTTKDSNIDNTGKTTVTLGTSTDNTIDAGYYPLVTAIRVEKATNGQDADTGNGPELQVGDTVTWAYVITNTGNETLNNIALNDDKEGAISCPNTTLAAGASMTCTKTGTVPASAVGTTYANTATVMAQGASSGTNVSDTDPSHYHVNQTLATIRGNVSEVDANGNNPQPLPGVTIILFDLNDNEVARTVTDSNGNYEFTVPTGTYVVREIQPTNYYSVSEDEGGADDDAIHPVLNTLKVVLTAGEQDIANDFVESKQSGQSCCLCVSKTKLPGASITDDGNTKVYWEAVNNVQAYEVYIDGRFVTTLPKSATEFTFDGLESDKDYTVEIVAIGPKGGQLTQTIKFKTPQIDVPWLPAILNMML